jgi:beta-phosphoglucomutase
MRVSLINIENHIEPALLSEAVDLVRASNEYAIQHPDQAHYQVHSTNPAYQVDIHLLPENPSASSRTMANVKCYCKPFIKTKQCKHAVAAILLLREYLQQSRKNKNKSRQDATLIDDALRKMKITDLKHFLAQYANSHASFKAELLAHTLHLTKKPDYISLLMTVTPIDKYGQIKINRNNIKTLRGIISILLKHAQQLFKERALPETFQILDPVINYLYRIIQKFPQFQQPLVVDLKTALRLFELVCLQPMAPRLQQAAIKFAVELSEREGYFFVKNTIPVLQLIEPFVLEQKMRQHLVQLAEQKINSHSSQSLSWASLLLRWGNRWQLKLKSKAVFKELVPLQSAILQEMNQQRDYEDLLFVLRLMPEPIADKAQHRISLQLGLKAAMILEKEEDITWIATALSQQYFDIDAWDALRKSNSIAAHMVIERLQFDYSPGDNETVDSLLLHGLKAMHHYDELLERLSNIQDAELMMEYDHLLVKDHRDAILQFYAIQIRSIKDAYGGSIARQKLNNIFSHLKTLDLYQAMVDKIKKTETKKVNNNNHHTIIEGFVFDLDGVIVDTAIHHFQSWKKLMHEMGVEIADEDDHHTRGASRMESLEYLLQTYGIQKSDAEKHELAARKNEYYLKAIEEITPNDLLPGALQFLIDSRQAGLRLALGSASKNARGVLEKLEIEHHFDAILDGNDAKESKPHPEIFIKASEALELNTDHVVVFEDAAKGVQAALAAGCHCIGIGDASTLGAADIIIPGLYAATPQEIIEQLS